MFGYILKRLGVAILTLLVIMTITFFLMNAVPGSPFLTEKATPEMIARANAKYGLDKPLYVQLFNYVKSYLRGDLGTSYFMKGTVNEILRDHMVPTLQQTAVAVAFAALVGVPFGA